MRGQASAVPSFTSNDRTARLNHHQIIAHAPSYLLLSSTLSPIGEVLIRFPILLLPLSLHPPSSHAADPDYFISLLTLRLNTHAHSVPLSLLCVSCVGIAGGSGVLQKKTEKNAPPLHLYTDF